MKTETLAPPLKWAGGKRWLLPRLQELYRHHRHRRLVVPFVGGAGDVFGLAPKRALLNDINSYLMAFYSHLKNGLVNDGRVPMRNDRETYDAARARFNSLRTTHHRYGPEAALLFYYLNRTGFNGLCRHKNITYVEDFRHYSPAMALWQLQSTDFEQVRFYPGDFVYVDPPYDGTEFTGYFGAFTWEDQVRLVEWLKRHEGPAVATNRATDRILEMYQGAGFTIRIVEAPRRIACNGDREPVQEMLAIKNV